ncbi:MAG: alkaline phosphatase family protein [Gemmatimonadetes bacterium]|nr:alkaline phosphatase family protein [Gemmatimonadota bacterium]
MRRRLLFVFLDGVGLGTGDPAVNPFAAGRLPTFTALLDGAAPLLEAAPRRARRASLLGLDATLGTPGLPQSGTGQAALLTGEDAPRLFGRHFGPWTPTALRPLVATRSILARARDAGRDVAFANAYPEELVAAAGPDLARLPGPLRAGPPLAALGAGVLTRHTADLERGRALASEITNDGWRERLHRRNVPAIAPEDAGRTLAQLAGAHDLTLFAHYATDYVGHRGGMPEAVAALERVDAFLAGLLNALPRDVLLVVASDHGNIEDVRAGHTTNPALALVAGDGHEELGELRALTDVAPAVLRWLEIE